MKRTIILLACALGIFTANAQSVVESTKFTDNCLENPTPKAGRILLKKAL